MKQFIKIGEQIGGLTGGWAGPIVVGTDKMYMVMRRVGDPNGEIGISRALGGGLLGAVVEAAVKAAIPERTPQPPVTILKLSELGDVTSHEDWPLPADILKRGLPKLDDCEVTIYDKKSVRIRKLPLLNRAMIYVDGRSYKVDHVPFTWRRIRRFLIANGWLE